MLAGIAEIDITPQGSVWMDGMIRSHRSTGVHDRLHARALCLASDPDPKNACVLAAMDLIGISGEDALGVRQGAEKTSGIPADRIILAASHTHSGPATIGYFNPKERQYAAELVPRLIALIERAASTLEPAAAGCASGREDTIGRYRRLLARDGRVVMNWEPYPAERIIGALGPIDAELGVLRVASAREEGRSLGIAFNHAGHPNVLSGDNYRISADYPGLASRLVAEKFGCPALFLNGAQGTMDIDGLRDRDWQGVQGIGTALAKAVAEVASRLSVSSAVRLRSGSVRYEIPSRKISESEYAWAEGILAKTGGEVQPRPDGIGDDFKAALLRQLREREQALNTVEQICLALDDCAFISFPGELFTEIGMDIKKSSPFRHTYIIGLANGAVGYVPTREAIWQGGYEVETRRLADGAADMILERSLGLLREVCKR